MTAPAVISDCGRYRYLLTRRWGVGPTLGWVMLNPSTADATTDDPTIRRCIAFAQREAFGAIAVVNLFAVRLTDSRELRNTVQPFGPDLAEHIRAWAWTVDRVVVAWGAHPMARGASWYVLADVVEGAPYLKLRCLGTTKDGSPRHPLYVRGDQPLIPWAGYPGVASV